MLKWLSSCCQLLGSCLFQGPIGLSWNRKNFSSSLSWKLLDLKPSPDLFIHEEVCVAFSKIGYEVESALPHFISPGSMKEACFHDVSTRWTLQITRIWFSFIAVDFACRVSYISFEQPVTSRFSLKFVNLWSRWDAFLVEIFFDFCLQTLFPYFQPHSE